ncbi:MAG: hypothetical protein L3J14_04675 [Flavobacteriaceae bacterium]|nr:hypothetical protein [Flavobacteriaceae bacterium]
MKKFIGNLILKLGGWTEDYPQNINVDKCIMISAPHTSFKDYIYTVASFWKREEEVKILFKNNQVISLSNCFFRKIFGIRFDDITKEGIDYSVELINKAEELILIVPTECCYKKVDKWNTEFYDIASEANVPVALGYLDYSDRTLGVGHMFSVNGDKKKDLKKIQNFYKNFTAKIPENYNTTIC